MRLKADNTSLYGFIIILIIFIIVLSFSAVTLVLLSRLVDNRIEVSSLQENWLQIKSGALAVLFAENPESEEDKLEKKISAFENSIAKLMNPSFSSVIQKVYPEVTENYEQLKDNWQEINNRLENIFSAGLPGDLISEEEALPFLKSLSGQISWLYTNTDTFSRDLNKLVSWFDSHLARIIKSFQVLFFLMALSIFCAIITMISVIRDFSRSRTAEARVRNLTQALLETQENERMRLAFDLHDYVAQDISAAKIICENMIAEEREGDVRIKPEVAKLINMLDTCMGEIRQISYDLHPSALEKLGLIPGISELCRDFAASRMFLVDFSHTGMDRLELDFDLKINLYRIVQEALVNIGRHAQADRVSVKLVATHPKLLLRIEDNGIGFDYKKRIDEAQKEKHMGLQSMEQRVGLLKGKINITSQPGEGVRILIELPLNIIEEKNEHEV